MITHLREAMLICEAIRQSIEGKYVRVTEEWRDQPFGRSRPDLKGAVRQVTQVIVDPQAGRVCVLMKDCRMFATLLDLNNPKFQVVELWDVARNVPLQAV